MKATLAGLALAAAHAVALPFLLDATARAPLELAWPGPLAAEQATPGTPSIGDAVASHDGGAPGLVWTRWTVRYRGGIERSVGAAQLVGPFQDPAAPPCSGRLVVGQRLLDDPARAAGTAPAPGTVAAVIAAELDRSLRDVEVPGAGAYRRAEDVRVAWSAFASHPRDVALFPAAALRAPTPAGMLRVEAILVYDRVRMPVTLGALPRIDPAGASPGPTPPALASSSGGGKLSFTIGVRARLDFENRVLDWVNSRVGGDRLVSRLAAGQLDTALLAALGAPPPLTLPGGPTLTVELCPDRAVEIGERAWAAVPLRWKLSPAVAVTDGGAAIRPPLRGGFAFPPPGDAALTLDLDLDGLNGLLFELWRSGWLDARLDELDAPRRFNEHPTVATYLTLRLSPLRLPLPPVLRPTAGDGIALDAAARVDIADGALTTPAVAWASLAVGFRGPAAAGAGGIVADVGVTRLELSCEPAPGRYRPCYGDVVGAIRDAAPSAHAALAGTLSSALDRVFVDQRLTAPGAPAALALTGARARTLASGDARGVRIELDASVKSGP